MDKGGKRLNILDSIFEILGGIQIAAPPTIIGFLVGYFIYKSKHDTVGLIIAAIMTIAGLLLGTVWAILIYKKRGMLNFMSRVSASPDLDKKDNKEDDEK